MRIIEPSCPKCGIEKRRWADISGFFSASESETYCCRGCAVDTGCTCRNP